MRVPSRRLPDEVYVGLVRRDDDALVVRPVRHEDEVRLRGVRGSLVDGCLHAGVVAVPVGVDDGVKGVRLHPHGEVQVQSAECLRSVHVGQCALGDEQADVVSQRQAVVCAHHVVGDDDAHRRAVEGDVRVRSLTDGLREGQFDDALRGDVVIFVRCV